MGKKTGFILIVAGVLIGAAAIAGSFLATDHHHSGNQIVGHGGGLDSCGGHTNHKTGRYHYHRGPFC
ncbi:MAG: YHYH domain-containing protein [Alphaproteobacteria bacterium]|nr:YHYH domain-containing protein [Alphaproteobacteria bacterium]MBT4016449.1 YHYH domain-containing protein [Alphaproteobacteria bacterium]MBT4965999.1 YHYH domain-containing protein [Alphaproteobacteria bacterium]MBT5160873.1 YHYH domain-containing protein [Alphaproteobacteria bacterium]MBT5918277.1 YHYH domain-containing protein [Alphaproteobacteria bacterium]